MVNSNPSSFTRGALKTVQIYFVKFLLESKFQELVPGSYSFILNKVLQKKDQNLLHYTTLSSVSGHILSLFFVSCQGAVQLGGLVMGYP